MLLWLLEMQISSSGKQGGTCYGLWDRQAGRAGGRGDGPAGSQKLYPGGRTIRAVLPGGRLYGGAMVFFRELRHRHHPAVFYAGSGNQRVSAGQGLRPRPRLLGGDTPAAGVRYGVFPVPAQLRHLLHGGVFAAAAHPLGVPHRHGRWQGADPPPLAGGSGAGLPGDAVCLFRGGGRAPSAGCSAGCPPGNRRSGWRWGFSSRYR